MAKQVDLEQLGKPELRNLATKLGVAWDKRQDDEDSLREKIRKAQKSGGEEKAAKTPADDAFGGKRADTVPFAPGTDAVAIDPATGKRVRPLDCFGWFHDPKDSVCAKVCPDREKCSVLSAQWTKKAGPDAVAKLESLAEAKAEAGKLTEDEVAEAKAAEKAVTKKAKEKTKKAEEDEEEEAEGEEEEETLASTAPERRGLTEKTKLKLNYDEEHIETFEEDDQRKLYRRLFKRYSDGKTFTVKDVIDVLAAVAGEDLDEDTREQAITDIVQPMVDDKELTVVK